MYNRPPCLWMQILKRNKNETQQELCDSASGKGALRCNTSTTGCPGAVNNYCIPYNVWSGDYQTAGSQYYYGNLNSGTFNATTGNYADYKNAYSVRCVLDLTVGSNAGNCYPNIIWSETESGSGHYDRYLANGTFNQEMDKAATFAFGVRCVLGFEFSRRGVCTIYTAKRSTDALWRMVR